MSLPLVGIIANPASGRDIRRLVAHGTVFDNNEKTAIVRRVLLGLEAVGTRRVAYMPEHDFGILPRALTELQGHPLQFAAEPLEMPVLGTSADSTRAAQLLAEMGAGCIITLGGDGTNRVVAKGCGTVPLVPISTGTNNVFPTFLEGTVAGMAAGLVARGCTGKGVLRRAHRCAGRRARAREPHGVRAHSHERDGVYGIDSGAHRFFNAPMAIAATKLTVLWRPSAMAVVECIREYSPGAGRYCGAPGPGLVPANWLARKIGLGAGL